ncbi:aspartate carbamoyltransferase [bacterium]|nr:aspartate carbamoyltransferase [bacterium]
MLRLRHFIDLEEYTTDEIMQLLELANEMEARVRFEKATRGGSTISPLLPYRVMASLFWAPSTRTRLSFETAKLRLGGSVIGFAEAASSSVAKGESLADTIRMSAHYADVIAMRHPKDGSAYLASKFSTVPVLNGGDGGHLHPSQTLLDLYTIYKEFGTLKGLKVALCGDLLYGRTTHSLSIALAAFDSEVVAFSPVELELPGHVTEHLKRYGKTIEQRRELAGNLDDIQVLYMTRIQKERFVDPAVYEKVGHAYILDKAVMATAPTQMIVMHPLPRVDEIAVEVDADPRARYFEQAFNGVPARMALIAVLLGQNHLHGKQGTNWRVPTVFEGSCPNQRCITHFDSNATPEFYELEQGKLACRYCDAPV